jgi:hypothetical protein
MVVVLVLMRLVEQLLPSLLKEHEPSFLLQVLLVVLELVMLLVQQMMKSVELVQVHYLFSFKEHEPSFLVQVLMQLLVVLELV